MKTDEAVASALLQIAQETSGQLVGANSGKGVDQYTPLTKAALETFDMQSMSHMTKKELEKQAFIKELRRTKELEALQAEKDGKLGTKSDEGLMVSPIGQQEKGAVVIVNLVQEETPKDKNKTNEDEHIERLVHDDKDDN